MLGDLADCDLVIESVVEDLDVKKQLFRELDHDCRTDAILATNTSTLPVVELAVETGRPERVCGIHFFNPAPVMSLVEIVRPLTASDETIAAAREFAERVRQGRRSRSKDRAGFIVNALLFPYLNNAVRMLEAGTASREDIDAAMKGGCNFPMGPFALLDLVGLDTSVAILDALYDEFRDPNYAPVPAAAPHGHRGPPRSQVRLRLLRLPQVAHEGSMAARPVEPPPTAWHFPPVDAADEDGLVGVGADLEPGTLLAAYRSRPVPDAGRTRRPDGLVVARSPRRAAARRAARVAGRCAVDVAATRCASTRAFEAVMRACGDPRRAGGWITEPMVVGLRALHELGWAHSVETWSDRRRARRWPLRRRDRWALRRRVDVQPRGRRVEGRARRAWSTGCVAPATGCSTCSGRRRILRTLGVVEIATTALRGRARSRRVTIEVGDAW